MHFYTYSIFSKLPQFSKRIIQQACFSSSLSSISDSTLHSNYLSLSLYIPLSPSRPLSGPQNTVPVGLLYLITHSCPLIHSKWWSQKPSEQKSTRAAYASLSSRLALTKPCQCQSHCRLWQGPMQQEKARQALWVQLEPMKETGAFWDSWHPAGEEETGVRFVDIIYELSLPQSSLSVMPGSVKEWSSGHPAGQWAV